MPTIKQLPVATAVGANDLLPLSQNGLTRSTTVSTLLSNTQPLLSLAQGTLLGRVSAGLGGPEAVSLGTGLAQQAGAIFANGADHVSFSLSTGLLSDDEVILNSSATPKRLPASKLRALFTAGSGVQIDDSGVISVTATSGGGTGVSGPKGDTGAQGPAGQGFTFRGPWQPNVGYSAYDVVTNGGQTYVAAVAVPAAATFVGSSWALVAAQGSAGATGATGPAGPIVAASASSLGAVKPGAGLSVATDGTLSISNVSLSSIGQGSATVGQLLGWSGTAWAPTTAASGVSFTGASPVSVSSGVISLSQNNAVAGQVLTWNGTTWTPSTPASSVSYTGAAPVSVSSGVISLSQNNAAIGQVLTWSGSAWAPTTPATSVTYTGAVPISVSSGVISLSQNNASVGQVLTWSGSAWAPTTPATSIGYTGAAPISVSSGVIGLGQNNATVGQVLTWTGTAWVPQAPAATGAVVGTAIPLSDGTASAGSAPAASREDHRHPTDTTRAPTANPVFSGSMTLPSWTTTTRPNSPNPGMEGYATDTGRRETYTPAGWVQYVRTGDLSAASGQLLGGSTVAGTAAAISIGSGLSLVGGTLSATTASTAPTISGVSIDGNTIVASLASPYQMAAADRVVDVNKSTGAQTKLLLPQNPTLWVEYTIIDGKGDAGTNNIVLALAQGGTINGQATFTMNANNDAIALRAVNATTWRIS